MAVRVVAADVKKVVSTSLADAVVDDPIIVTANLLVDEHLLDSGLSAALLTKIELYMAAHLVALTEEKGGVVRETLGDAARSYANVYEGGLKSTRYGQMAIAIDSTGTLAGLSTNKLRAQITVI